MKIVYISIVFFIFFENFRSSKKAMEASVKKFMDAEKKNALVNFVNEGAGDGGLMTVLKILLIFCSKPSKSYQFQSHCFKILLKC